MPDLEPTLILHPISSLTTGERQPRLDLVPPGPFVVGRSSEVEWVIPDQAVSRRHAMIAQHADRWFISDLESRHGTMVNGKPIAPGDRFPLETGDLVQFGAWACRCQSSRGLGQHTTAFEERPRGGTQVSTVKAAELAGLAQLRLDALLTVSREFNSVPDSAGVAQATVQAVHTATGCGRVMVVKQVTTDEFETLASTATEPPRLSRSLIEAAGLQRSLVELCGSEGAAGGGPDQQAHSILDLKIRTAICAPIIVGKSPEAFLYLDTRDTETALPKDAAAFCQSVAQLAGFSLERIRNAALAERHAQLENDLGAARRAQELLMPPKSGTVGATEYAYESLPGRVVAGDLFDVFPLSDTRTAVLLGDVTGKGVGAAVLMAATQSQLRTQILSGKPFARAIEAVSHDLNRHSEVNKFVTLIAAIIDAANHTIELVDAGHGFAVHATPDAGPIKLQPPTGFPLGVIENADYESQVFPFGPGSQLVVFSDGVVEQPNLAGEQFGYDAAMGVIAGADTPASIAAALLDAVRKHAAADLADDLTVAAIRLDAH
ncbi:MAG: sigma-B regulation protein RsbU (phosphoserine phosphatase) [Phycisphaerales bacterium]|jgi:sigma-B regulation protein RsbU (phosphoserine phosphatase)